MVEQTLHISYSLIKNNCLEDGRLPFYIPTCVTVGGNKTSLWLSGISCINLAVLTNAIVANFTNSLASKHLCVCTPTVICSSLFYRYIRHSEPTILGHMSFIKGILTPLTPLPEHAAGTEVYVSVLDP